MFAWEFDWHELHGGLPGKLSLQWLLTYLSGIEIRDSQEGITPRPTGVFADEVAAVSIQTVVPKIGILLIRSARDAGSELPGWAGKAVSAGEVWRSERVGAPTSFVIASRSAIGRLWLAFGEEFDEAAFKWLSDLGTMELVAA